jgi:hypothetical protein
LSGALAVLTVVVLAACADSQPTVTGIEPPLLGKGGGGDPKVEATDPSEAPQDTTLDVRVLGSGFDNGSAVRMLLGGKATEKVRTNSTRFVNKTELVANITIDIDAEVALYDVEVTTSRRRKGIGTELFAVKEKGKPGEEPPPHFEVVVTDNDTLTQYWLGSDGRGTYERFVDCVRINANDGNFFFRTVGPSEECLSLKAPDWRFFELHVPNNTSFDFDQDGTFGVVEGAPGRLQVAGAFTEGATSGTAGLAVFEVNPDGTTGGFQWHIQYANDALVDQVHADTVDMSMPQDRADVAWLCEYVKRGKGKGGGRICEERDPNGLKLPFQIRAIRLPPI